MDPKEELRAHLEQFERLIADLEVRRRTVRAEGNTEAVGKLHQTEREFKKRVAEIRRQLGEPAP